MTFAEQRINTPSIINARELGGYVLPSGARVRRGLLLRGGSLASASDADIRLLSDTYHVVRVFDFRTSMEVGADPDRDVPGATHVWLPAFNERSCTMAGTFLPHEAYRDLGNWLVRHACEPAVRKAADILYTSMVDEEFTQVQFAGFLQNILGTDGGAVYWHCSQGKDRTGLAAAFILAALGADRDLIMADYAMSNEFYTDELALYRSMVESEEEKSIIQTFIGVNCDCFAGALDLIDRKWGSMKNFLTGPLCFSEEDMETLRKRYLEF